jgi:seryl-tRNA synthetase
MRIIVINVYVHINENIKKEFLEKIYYINKNITKVNVKKNYIQISLNKKINKQEIKIKTINLVNNLKKIFSDLPEKVIYSNLIKFKKKIIDINKILINQKLIKKISDGIFSIEGKLLDIKNTIDNLIFEFARINNYKTIDFKGFINIESIIQNGYLAAFPHHCLFVSNIERNQTSIKKVSDISNKNELNVNKLQKPSLVLSPTVCYNCFDYLKNSRINLPTKITALANCARYESLNYDSLKRLKVFSMRELMFFGSRDFINSHLQDNINYFIKIFKKLKICFRVCTATDPFFSKKYINKKAFQIHNNLKYEIQMYLPYEKEWLAVGSFNNHLDTLTKKYKITGRKNKNVFSGCVGFGYERLIYSIYSQKYYS